MTKRTVSFEEALKALEQTVEQLESGDLSLADSLAVFERGVASAHLCQQLLGEAENQVERLLRDRDGGFQTEPFETGGDDA